ASSRRPSANRFNQSAPMSFGSASETRKPSGVAPLAARSERLTRSALRATSAASSWGKKCTPPMMASVLSTTSVPGAGVRKAASSVSASAPGCVAIGLKKSAIRRSSADILSSEAPMGLSGGEFVGPQLARQLVEHGVDHAGLVAADEGGGDVGVFGDDGARRHVLAMHELVGPGPHRCAQDRLDALQGPRLLQGLVDHRIEHTLLAQHAGDDVAEERGLGRQVLR